MHKNKDSELSKLSEMKEILKSNLNNARNARYFQFHADEDTAFIQNQAYEATKEVEEKDKVRDDLFLYIKQTIESNLRCPLADKKAAVVKLEFLISSKYTNEFAKKSKLIETD